MRRTSLRFAIAGMFAIFATAAQADGNACDPVLSPENALTALRTAHARTIGIVPVTRSIPGGATTEVVLQEKFDPTYQYQAIVEIDGARVEPRSRRAGMEVHAKAVPDDHALVAEGKVIKGNGTLVSFRVAPYSLRPRGDITLYVYGCAPGAAGQPESLKFMGQLATTITSGFYSGLIVIGVVVALYLLFATAAWLAYRKKDPDGGKPVPATGSKAAPAKERWHRYLDPIFMTAGPTGRGSLSKLQVLFFSLIVFGLVSFIVLRTGILSDLSPTILMLLGISGIATAASQATDVKQNRLDFDNWAWLVNKGWFPAGGLAATTTPRWRDIVTSSNEFDIYRFQSVIFSLVVGASLLVTGLTDLASFRVPETILGILGLSQVVYLSGKIVSPPSCKELDQKLTELQAAERAFLEWATKDKDGIPIAPPATPAEARQRAQPEYDAYKRLAEKVRTMFTATLGLPVSDAQLEPAFPWDDRAAAAASAARASAASAFARPLAPAQAAAPVAAAALPVVAATPATTAPAASAPEVAPVTADPLPPDPAGNRRQGESAEADAVRQAAE